MTVQKAPLDVFAAIVQYFPTISINMIVENPQGEFLFVKRSKQPVKGYWWLPGGRILSGEPLAGAAERILREETNLSGRVAWISPEYAMETFEVGKLDAQEQSIYSDALERFQYLSIPVHIVTDGASEVAMDGQSRQFAWSRENLSTHPYIARYFEMWRQ